MKPATLKPDFSEAEKIGLTQQKTLRKLVGILGMALPLLLYFFTLADTGYTAPLDSLSHYYFTRAASLFCMVVSLLAIFLIIYKGKEPIDFYLSCAAGFSALCLVLFPTYNITDICCDADYRYAVTVLKTGTFRALFHYIAAALFLLCLAALSFFVFTRSSKAPAHRSAAKKRRNRTYRVCALVMVLALLMIFWGGYLGGIPESDYSRLHLTFWMETLAIEAFGLSWLVKGATA
ncbi:DUF998 domain-containing protein [Niabella terrae]